jgi:hypothetical protein
VMGFFKIGSFELFAWTGFEHEPPELCLLSSWDYRHEPQVPGHSWLFKKHWSVCQLSAASDCGVYSCGQKVL